ncbi:hypothetical protein TWF225_006037 [Orbilia oligospora]|nr:hypothetical protein TWF225_006037 [Orbilia oligospora]
MRSDHLDTGPIRKPQRNRETSWTEALPRMDPERLDTSAHHNDSALGLEIFRSTIAKCDANAAS